MHLNEIVKNVNILLGLKCSHRQKPLCFEFYFLKHTS